MRIDNKVGVIIHEDLCLIDEGDYFDWRTEHSTRACNMVSGVCQCIFHWVTFLIISIIGEGMGQLITSAVLLDQHQEVLDIPSESNTSPHR